MKLEDYNKFRWFFTSSGILVIGGKSAIQNDELLYRISNVKEDVVIMHTSSPGSPFSVILEDKTKVSLDDIEECAVFTGCFSKAWKEGKAKTKVDIFSSSQIHKSKDMKPGTWGVYGKVKTISVPLELAMTRQNSILRAVPLKTLKNKKKIVKIVPGKIDKDNMLAKLEIVMNEPLNRDEVLTALPAGRFRVLK